ncbi:MAG: O-antigen ligase family protein [Akkermansiaceae bacterium]|nr:O-antigen ligase family protein [Armatimonadota bacterium]
MMAISDHVAAFVGSAKSRERGILTGSILLTLALGAAYTAFQLDSPLLPVILIISLMIPVVLWCSARAVLYVVFAGTCLFELFPSGYADSLTERIPLFWNVNTIFQIYAHVNFKAIPFNLVEVIMIIATVCSLIRAVFTKTFSLRGGALLVPVSLYLFFVVWGWINGLATGGDFKLSLQEVRAQFYFGAAYFMAVHLVQEAKQIGTLWWIMAICVSFKGLLYTYRRYVTIGGLPLPDQGVGSHEEAFLFAAFVLILIVLSLASDPQYRALRTYLWLNLPIVILGYLATNRRAGTAALVIALPMMLFAAFRAFPHRRRAIAAVGLAGAILGPIYYNVFKNSEAAIAQPARAIRSNFEPDARDASSNIYRDAENANQMATIRLAPVQGYGYGKRMLHAVQIADISGTYEWWDLLPHNQILWVWMRVGTVGFVTFWVMFCSAIILCCHAARDEDAPAIVRCHAVFCLATLVALLMFGLYDMALSNFRAMLFAAIWLGALSAVYSPSPQTAEHPQIRKGN